MQNLPIYQDPASGEWEVQFRPYLWTANLDGDIDGIGVGSDLAIAGALGGGYDINDKFALEIMTRYLSVDYENGGFQRQRCVLV